MYNLLLHCLRMIVVITVGNAKVTLSIRNGRRCMCNCLLHCLHVIVMITFTGIAKLTPSIRIGRHCVYDILRV